MRPSGIELCAGVLPKASPPPGVDVVDLGLASTDELYFASGASTRPGAMFTASHNPASYNGIKLCLSGARPVGADTGLARDHGVGRHAATEPASRRHRPGR